MKRLGILITLLLFASFVVVLARSSYLTGFNNLYGTDGTRLDTCNLCHGSSYSVRNSYGVDFNTQRQALGDVTLALQAIESTDSDHDGDSNIAEILARVFPGNPSSNVPVEESTWGKVKALYE